MSQLENEYKYYKSKNNFWIILKYLFLVIFIYAIFNILLHLLLQVKQDSSLYSSGISIYNIFRSFVLVPTSWSFDLFEATIFIIIFFIPYMFCVYKATSYSNKLSEVKTIINQAHNELKKEELKNKYRK